MPALNDFDLSAVAADELPIGQHYHLVLLNIDRFSLASLRNHDAFCGFPASVPRQAFAVMTFLIL